MQTESLLNALRSAHAVLFSAGVARVLLCVLGCVLLAIAGIALADATFGFSAATLVWIDLGIAFATVLLGGGLLVAAWRSRFRPAAVAAAIERRGGTPGGMLVGALQLADQTQVGTSAALSGLAVGQAAAAAQAVEPRSLVRWDVLRRAAGVSLIGLVLLIAAGVLMPGLYNAVLPRLLQPLADHPPYTPLRFEVVHEPEAAVVGRPATIRVRIRGTTTPLDADLVVVDEGGGEPARVRMARDLRDAGVTFARHDVRGSEAVPAKPSKRTPQAFQWRIPRAERSLAFYIDTPEGRSRRYQLDVRPVPRVERLEATYVYPDYTGWAPATQAVPLSGPRAGLRAIAGSRVTLNVQSNVPLQANEVTLPGGNTATWQIDPQDTHRATCSLTLGQNGDAVIALRSAAGYAADRPLRLPVVVREDAKPRVYIAEPEPRVIVPEGFVVQVRIRASDDIAVERITLSRGVNGWPPSVATLTHTYGGQGRTHATATTEFDLAALGAVAGDQIRYFATVWDGAPGGGQAADSSVCVIQVISEAEYLDYERTRYRIEDLNEEWADFEAQLNALAEGREQLLEKLAAAEDALAADDRTPEQQAALDAWAAEIEDYRDDALAFAEALERRAEQRRLYEFEEAYAAQLRKLAAGMQLQGSTAAGLAMAIETAVESEEGAADRVAKWAERLREEQRPYGEPGGEAQQEREQLTEDLEAMQWADTLAGLGDELMMLIKEQRVLPDRLGAMSGGGATQNRLEEWADDQEAVAERLRQVTQELRAAGEGAAEHLPRMGAGAVQMADHIDQLAIHADMLAAAAHARAEEVMPAHAEAAEAADKLASLQSDCDSMQQGGQQDLDGCFSLPKPRMHNALNQMARGRQAAGLGSRQGQAGSGFAGSKARVGVQGPASDRSGQGSAASRRKHAAASGGGAAVPGDAEVLDPGESLETDADVRDLAPGVILQGVPMQYRAEAAAYFKRLAQDAAGEDNATQGDE